MLSALPWALLTLLFASPVFTTTTATATISTSPNDLFRAVALRVPKPPQNPICCLKPTPSEPVDDGVLLSFEEWKMKQQAMQGSPLKPNEKEVANRGPTQGPGDGGLGSEAGNSSEITATPVESSPPPGSSSPEVASEGEWADFSFLQVPTTDRFNYASLDCSARVHTAHRSAKSPSSILSSKRDRYMLSPCDTSKEKHFVVVELCDDIRIDTVQLANFEFFSGVFKDFTVSVAKTYTTEPDGWTLVKGYQAKNIRGVQTFRPPKSLRDFYRFIRIDFLSHYGNEYYCPVSLLRVYGLTHLEEWKWDIWESESRQKQADLQKKRLSSLAATATAEPSGTAVDPTTQLSTEPKELNDSVAQTTIMTADTAVYHSESNVPSPSPSQPPDLSTSNVKKAATTSGHPTPTNDPKPSSNITLGQNPKPTHDDDDPDIHSTHAYVPPHTTNSASQAQAHSEDQGSTISLSESLIATPTNSPVIILNGSHSPSAPNQSQPASDSPSTIVSPSLPSISVIPIVTTSLPPAVKGGESIYRTILNRLAEVETNHTLYMLYIEQQNLAVRDVIKKLGEDVGRFDGISRAQSLTYQRMLDRWERQRYQLDMEYGDLLSRIESLSEEIVLEKRLGVAQLCLLLAVLIFMGLTRGSRAEALIDHSSTQINRSVREWGKRHFKLSGDWAGRFKGKNLETSRRHSRSSSRSVSRTRTPLPIPRPRPQTAKSYPPHLPLNIHDDTKFTFPSTSSRGKMPLETIQLNSAPPGSELYTRPRTRTMSNPRSRAPSLRSTPATRRIQHIAHQKPITPHTTTFRPHLMQRWSSQGGPVPASGSWGSMSMPKSAKKWARTAHLHEVKTPVPTPSAEGRQHKLGENTRHDRENDRTPKEFDFEREREDVFSSSIAKLSTNSLPMDMNVGAGRSPTIERSLLLKPEVIMDDGDPWVDTDSVDGSEIDLAALDQISASLPS
ncbi:hypothetical protein M413DRAFT_395619 [Hebeloma cylindrosporum]|uniref:SUN domain-containing protein n=1 Tax=Hebeloma cylindrosporum TaxID=76867 RepID=A0A0C3C2B8_HEBCY|nr:hypothetical protein M413DRAFT_395619 [Hebeloma cylindrosporum h7]